MSGVWHMSCAIGTKHSGVRWRGDRRGYQQARLNVLMADALGHANTCYTTCNVRASSCPSVFRVMSACPMTNRAPDSQYLGPYSFHSFPVQI